MFTGGELGVRGMKCLACGGKVLRSGKRLIIFDWTCDNCGFTLEVGLHQTTGKRHYHYWEREGRRKKKAVRFLDVPPGCLLVVNWEPA